jgi:exopolysaccharide biosynthesis polyprenyl glycosylphosphotransferase
MSDAVHQLGSVALERRGAPRGSLRQLVQRRFQRSVDRGCARRAGEPQGDPRSGGRGALVRRALLGADVFALLLTFACVDLMSRWTLDLGLGHRLLGYAVAGGGVLVVLALYGLYGRDEVRADHTTPDDVPHVFQAATTAGLLSCAVAQALGHAGEVVPAVLIAWPLLTLLVPSARGVARVYARRHEGYQQRTLILGAGDVGQLMARKFLQHPEYGMTLVGFLDDAPRRLTADLAAVPLLGAQGDLGRVVRDHHVDRVIVAFSGERHDTTLDAVRILKELDVQVDIVPRLFEVVGPNVDITTFEGMPVVVLPPLRLSRRRLAVKRAMDVCAAAGGLVALSPLFALVALAIRLDSPGAPVLYRGERVGRGGRRFRQLKFRTMRPEFCSGPGYGGDQADAAFRRLLRERPRLGEEFARTQKLRDDPRVTRVGSLLRRTSLDELPQLWNVLRGDLSLVGPRPITEQEMRDRYRPRILDPVAGSPVLVGYWDSPGLRPGLTGYWQISGRSRMSFDERVRLDTAYLTSWSLRLDVQILVKTFRALLPSRGAY